MTNHVNNTRRTPLAANPARVDFNLFVLVFNCLRNLAPSYLMNMCQPVTSNLRRRRLHSAVRGDLIVPPI